jgi:hypothetical protein
MEHYTCSSLELVIFLADLCIIPLDVFRHTIGLRLHQRAKLQCIEKIILSSPEEELNLMCTLQCGEQRPQVHI